MKKILTLLIFVSGISFTHSQGTANIELLYQWQQGDLVASDAFGNIYNEIWGFTQNSREYAVIGTTWGTHIFDISDPENPYIADTVAGGFQGDGVVHRDYHDYNGYLYMVCDEGTGQSTLQIADLRYLPDSVSVVYDSPNPLTKAHNIFIDTAKGKLYAFSPKFYPSGVSTMAIFSLDDPENPVIEKLYNGLDQIHDGFVRDDILYANAGPQGFFVFDVADVENMSLLGSLTTYPDQDYNHSGWLSDDGDIYVLADEAHGMALKVLDVSDPTDIQVLSTIHSGVDSNSIPHNVIIKGDYAYIAYYHDGLYIYNISDPESPSLFGYYDTYSPEDHNSYRGAWGVYPLLPSGNVLVSDMQYGLFVFAVDGISSINENETTAEFTVAPNPFSKATEVTLQLDSPEKIVLELHDVNGKLIQSKNYFGRVGSNTFVFTVNETIPTGNYWLTINTDTGIVSRQLVKF